MKNIIRITGLLTCLFLASIIGFSQTPTYQLNVLNQSVSGSNFEFDIYLLRVDAVPIYLGHCDFVLTFNNANFTDPAAARVTRGLPTLYTIAQGIYETNRFIVNVGAPLIGDQTDFDENVTNISSTHPGSLIGRFRITNISNPAGTAGLQWRNVTPNSTIVTTFANTSPWIMSNITNIASHNNPDDTPLPIQLASFSGTVVNGSNVLLEWTTISEINNYGFYVERRKDNELEFTEVPNSFIPGAGTTLEPQSYSFVDNTLTEIGLYHYRLRQVDNDGLTNYSQSVSINVSVLSVREAAPIEFRVHQNYPNPFNPKTTIKFSVDKVEHATVTVYNVLGQEVARLFDGVAEPGYYYKVELDGTSLASGLYFYRVITESKSELKKMVLVK